LDQEPTDLKEAVAAAVETMRDKAAAKGLELTAALSDGPGIVEGSAVRLQQIVWNLVSNAIKVTPTRGQGSVAMEIGPSGARVEVTATGIGIPPEFVSRLFDLFSQADTSTARTHGGLGLGLAIASRLAELHNGSLVAHSDGPGCGSRFVFEIPTIQVHPHRV